MQAFLVFVIWVWIVFFEEHSRFTGQHEKEGSYLSNSSLPLSPASQILTHQPCDYCREHSQHPDSNREPLASERKSLTAKLFAHLFILFSLMLTFFCVCVKCITLCNYLCSSSCYFSASLIRNIGEFGAKSYFTDHRRGNALHGFLDSFPVYKIYDCYQVTQKSGQLSIPIQAIQGDYSVLM